MKQIIVSVFVLAVGLTASAQCIEQKMAKKVIDMIIRYEVKLTTHGNKTIAEVIEDIKRDHFCQKPENRDITNFSIYLSQLNLCSVLNVEAGIFPGEIELKTKDPRNQKRFEQALLDYGLLFPAQGETDGFTCSLKKKRFPTLN